MAAVNWNFRNTVLSEQRKKSIILYIIYRPLLCTVYFPRINTKRASIYHSNTCIYNIDMTEPLQFRTVLLLIIKALSLHFCVSEYRIVHSHSPCKRTALLSFCSANRALSREMETKHRFLWNMFKGTCLCYIIDNKDSVFCILYSVYYSFRFNFKPFFGVYFSGAKLMWLGIYTEGGKCSHVWMTCP